MGLIICERGEDMDFKWNEKEKMSKEFALAALEEIKLFYRRLYFLPQKEPFESEADFVSATKIISGLKEYIENTME